VLTSSCSPASSNTLASASHAPTQYQPRSTARAPTLPLEQIPQLPVRTRPGLTQRAWFLPPTFSRPMFIGGCGSCSRCAHNLRLPKSHGSCSRRAHSCSGLWVVRSSATAIMPTLKLDCVHIRALLHTIRLKTLLDFYVVIFHVVVYVKTWVVYVET
jgi:hypothetical protein